MDSVNRDGDIRRRVLEVLVKAGSPVAPRYVRARHGVRGVSSEDFWRVLESMVVSGEVWSEDGMVSLNGTPVIPERTSNKKRLLPESKSIPGVGRVDI